MDTFGPNVTIETSKVDPSPKVKMKIERECIVGIGELENRMIIILDLLKLSDLIDVKLKKETDDQINNAKAINE